MVRKDDSRPLGPTGIPTTPDEIGRDCSLVGELLEPYIDGDLDAAQRHSVDEHVQVCSKCSRELEMARSLLQELRSLPVLECPDDLVSDVLATSRRRTPVEVGRADSDTGSRESMFAQSWWRAAAAVLVLGTGLLAGLWLLGEQGAEHLDEAARGEAAHTPAELEQAKEDLQVALAYFNGIAEKAGLVLRDEVIADQVLAPTRRAISRFGATGPDGALTQRTARSPSASAEENS